MAARHSASRLAMRQNDPRAWEAAPARSPQEISKSCIDDDEAGKNQGDGKPRLCLRASGGFGPLGSRTLERGDVTGRLADGMGFDIGWLAAAAHFLVLAFVA